MNSPGPSAPAVLSPRQLGFLPAKISIGIVVALVAVVVIAVLTLRANSTQRLTVRELITLIEESQDLSQMLSALKDAETGQRGFLLTGDEKYLAPFLAAKNSLPQMLGEFSNRVSPDDLQEQRRFTQLQGLVEEKLREMGETIDLSRGGDTVAALRLVRTDRGKGAMDRLRDTVEAMQTDRRLLLERRQAERADAVFWTISVTSGGSAVLVALILAAAYLSSRDYRSTSTEAWLRATKADLAARTRGDLVLEVLGEKLLTFLSEGLNAKVGALYISEGAHTFKRFAGYALPTDWAGATEVRPGDGLIGQVAKEDRIIHLAEVPDGYLPVSSSLGRASPRHIIVAPFSSDGVVVAVLELGLMSAPLPAEIELLERLNPIAGASIRSSKDRTRLEQFLEETQRQAEELQTQQEELRVSNEELEEQSRALRENKVRLEQQQAELEQVNSQMEEQMQLLENQKTDLQYAQTQLSDRANELQRAGRYKSEFLANMSHELRTPLNSSLILSKLLADNPNGNLTDEQVKFAKTITSAGNDLLLLINDILDLSKIEAGKLDIMPEEVSVKMLVDSMERTFAPVAGEKGLKLRFELLPGIPPRLETDLKRTQQILKNLLSNAIKFTEHGEVSLVISKLPTGDLSFSVTDTGIGIPDDKQEFIFEAFRQADGSMHRKYGGTGLGLSISRDLARLLGGDIELDSTEGKGSTFTLRLPEKFAGHIDTSALDVARTPAPREPLAVRALSGSGAVPAIAGLPSPTRERVPASVPQVAPPRPVKAMGASDDRNELTPGSRVLLVIEDDVAFSEILRDLAHEQQFQVLIADTADEGVALARQYLPSAVLLDMNLPDHSGLSVLDQLKRRSATRHIPVHVLSVEDHTRSALEMGAVGYALKPLDREQLLEAFGKLQARLTQTIRKLLIVEDDDVQRDAVGRLLASDEVQIIAVATAAAALEQLQNQSFDCMVLDLSLSDATGFELLETMASHERYGFPPVIVYTGRALSSEEEQRLRRYSRSIIIKGAHSPERLLDEVTLFLHQVEEKLPADRQRMLSAARHRETVFENRRILVVEDDIRNIFALSSVLEPKGAKIEIARNGREAVERLDKMLTPEGRPEPVDLVLMDIMMPEMDGLTAMRHIRKRPELARMPIIALTAKAMKDDQEKCLEAGANDYVAKPLDVEKLLSLIRVWMPK